eukprot:805973-Rhodomonas_salina.1
MAHASGPDLVQNPTEIRSDFGECDQQLHSGLQRDYSPRTQGCRSLATECRRNQLSHQAPPGGGSKGVHHS